MEQSDASRSRAASSFVVEQWETQDREFVCAALERWFPGITNLSFEGSTQDFRARTSTVGNEYIRLVRHADFGTHFDFSMPDILSVEIPIEGHCSYATNTASVSGAPGATAITQYGERLRVRLGSNYSGLVLAVSDSVLVDKANRLLGTEAVTRLQDFGAGADTVDVRKGPGALLARKAFAAFKEAETLNQIGLGALIVSEVFDHLVNLLLVTTLPRLRERLEDPVKPPNRREVARACEYIESRADGPVRISDVAHEFGMSVRALQVGFRNQLGRTPLEFLFECRMANARRRLLSAPPGATVTSIAMDCGFANVGAFAGRYQEAFGELPSETLGRRGRG